MARKRNTHCSGGCGRVREIGSNFTLDADGRPTTKCRFCTREEHLKWRREHPEAHKAIYRRCNLKANLKRRFGLTIEEYNALVEMSDGLCGICRQPESRDRRLSLDHDHQTGAIRGFLCSKCNLLLGNAGDDADLLERAINFLKCQNFPRTSDLEPPVPMLLHCPICGKQHLDVGEFATRRHTTHACQHCGLVWRPAIVATVGVEFLPGYKNP